MHLCELKKQVRNCGTMKFGKYLLSQIDPELGAEHYVPYAKLKGIIKAVAEVESMERLLKERACL